MRIVYVEDNPANFALVQRVARLGKHDVESFISGEDALEHVAEAPPDLLLVDIQLAGLMNGLELAEALKERNVQVPMVAVTAYAMLGDRDRCLEAGFEDYMPKPLPVMDLIQLFDRYNTAPAVVQGGWAMSEAGCALVVEDEPANQDFFVRLITQAGFCVQGATTAAEALELARTQDDLCLVAVDLQLPDMPGLDLIRELRGLLPEALLIVLTMWDEPAMIAEAFSNGCDVFLVKPHGFMELFQRLKGLPDTRPDLHRAIVDQYGLRPYTGPIDAPEPALDESEPTLDASEPPPEDPVAEEET